MSPGVVALIVLVVIPGEVQCRWAGLSCLWVRDKRVVLFVGEGLVFEYLDKNCQIVMNRGYKISLRQV